MIDFKRARLNLDVAQKEIEEFRIFLQDNDEIDETGDDGLQKFFSKRPNLLLLAGDTFVPSMTPGLYLGEPFLLGEFRADFLVADDARANFLFIEFEDAKRDSIFSVKGKGKTTKAFEWSKRFEHGFSQIVDWQFRIFDYSRTSKIEEHFLSRDFDYLGLLVIGRDRFIDDNGLRQRLKWRTSHTIIDSKPIHCITFDKFYTELSRRLSNRLQMRDEDRIARKT